MNFIGKIKLDLTSLFHSQLPASPAASRETCALFPPNCGLEIEGMSINKKYAYQCETCDKLTSIFVDVLKGHVETLHVQEIFSQRNNPKDWWVESLSKHLMKNKLCTLRYHILSCM